MKCSRKGCQGNGIWIPRFVLRQKKNGQILGANLVNHAVCAECRHDLKLEDLMSDEGWNKIQKHLRECGRDHFMKSLTVLEFTPHPEGTDECLPF